MSTRKKPRRGLFDWLKGDEVGQQLLEPSSGDEPAQTDPTRPEVALQQRFVDEGEVARGGMGSIRRVYDNNLLRRLAMKVLHPDAAKDSIEIQRFIEEAQITGQLEHPNIVPVHDLSVEGDTHYFTMKMVQGITLEKMLQDPAFSPAHEEDLFQALKVYIKVCEAVAYAHSRGVVHLDLKPANVMVGSFGQVYLMDWGIARMVRTSGRKVSPASRVQIRRSSELDPEGKVLGTLSYMPPEQADGKLNELDERSDIYALGGLLYRILTGKAPHSAPTADERWDKALSGEVEPPEQVATWPIPAKLGRIAMKALTPAKSDRYASVADLQAEVEAFMRGPGRFPVQSFKAGERIIAEGETGETAYVVQQGKVHAFRGQGSRRQELREMGAGAVFGEMAILTSLPRSATIEAVSDVQATVISRAALEQELDHSTWLGPIVKALAERFREVDAEARALMAKQRDIDLERTLWQLMTFLGSGTGSRREASWVELSAALSKKLGRSTADVLEQVKQLEGVTIEADRDKIIVKRP
jgi:serine/threonine-protein kinase